MVPKVEPNSDPQVIRNQVLWPNLSNLSNAPSHQQNQNHQQQSSQQLLSHCKSFYEFFYYLVKKFKVSENIFNFLT